VDIQSITLEVAAHHPYIRDLALSDFWLFEALKNISKDFISHVTKKQFRAQPEDFYTDGFEKKISAPATLYRTRETLREK